MNAAEAAADRPTTRDVSPSPGLLALSVALGGAAGALARTTLSLLAQGSPWMTLAENVAGTLLLGILLGWSARTRLPPWLLTGLGTGLLSSFTSMSAFAMDTVYLAALTPLDTALYVGGSLGLSLAAAWIGLRLGRHGFQRRPRSKP